MTTEKWESGNPSKTREKVKREKTMTTTTKSQYRTKFHRDATVTVWNVYTQQWERTDRPSDRVLASLDSKERDRVIRRCKIED